MGRLVALVAVAATALEPSALVIVMHSGHPDRRNYTESAKRGWLQKVPRYVIVDGMHASRRLMHVFYDDNPGCSSVACARARGEQHPHYLMIGHYYGAHRTLAGILVANDTWPDAKWVLVVDDDNAVQVEAVWRYLDNLDPTVPLLLAGRVGPGHDVIPCRVANNATHWSCCTNARQPCHAHLYGPQAVWEYHTRAKTFLPKKICPDAEVSNYCCRTKPWPDGIHAGFPFRTDPDGPYRPHFSLLWPYGGAGYILSRGLLDAIARDYWQHCLYGFQCANADHRVMACVLNAGFSLTRHLGGIPGIRHHISPSGIPKGVAAQPPKRHRQPQMPVQRNPNHKNHPHKMRRPA
mmetsp:Transcript_20313/g.63818  ORF Transcript_20313/g.63818 Transcript_20313/m.63818 type:complete len:350 (-) Transcript_20313:134-1183(-)